MQDNVLLEVKNLKKCFDVGNRQVLTAVDGLDFTIRRGETLGFVGESGCGKSTTGKTVMHLIPPTSGQILYDGRDITHMKRPEYLKFTKKAQMIFQDPYASLDSRMTAGEIIAEGMKIHGMYHAKEREERVVELLNTVGLNKEHASRFVHEFSGGQRQRIGIARALAIDPEFIVCDEPISALDVSIQAQVINLLLNLQRDRGLTYLFIAHDLGIVKHVSDRVAVMYLGAIVELAESDELYAHQLHPYTQALLSAIPLADPVKTRAKQRILLEGDVPSPIDVKGGCKFAGRCKKCMGICRDEAPKLKDAVHGHYVSCHLI